MNSFHSSVKTVVPSRVVSSILNDRLQCRPVSKLEDIQPDLARPPADLPTTGGRSVGKVPWPRRRSRGLVPSTPRMPLNDPGGADRSLTGSHRSDDDPIAPCREKTPRDDGLSSPCGGSGCGCHRPAVQADGGVAPPLARRRNKSTAPTDTAADASITIEDGSGTAAPESSRPRTCRRPGATRS